LPIKWIVFVEYSGVYRPDVDKAIEKRAGKSRDGSGYCFLGRGCRDLDFWYDTKRSADACMKRIRKAPRPVWPMRVRVDHV
jgi:hypothetical protein